MHLFFVFQTLNNDSLRITLLFCLQKLIIGFQIYLDNSIVIQCDGLMLTHKPLQNRLKPAIEAGTLVLIYFHCICAGGL